jgi:hypothetical protein
MLATMFAPASRMCNETAQPYNDFVTRAPIGYSAKR